MSVDPSNYQTALHRIRQCQTKGDCDSLEKSLQRCHKVGALTDSEYQRLDLKLVDQRVDLEVLS